MYVYENNFFLIVYIGLLHESSIFNINLPPDQLAFVLRLLKLKSNSFKLLLVLHVDSPNSRLRCLYSCDTIYLCHQRVICQSYPFVI